MKLVLFMRSACLRPSLARDDRSGMYHPLYVSRVRFVARVLVSGDPSRLAREPSR